MPADVKQLVVSGQSAGWAKWLVFAGAVLVTKSMIKAVSALIATGADFGGAQRGAIRELFRM
jgi:hypothetical protein